MSAVDGHSLNGRRDAETAALLDGAHPPPPPLPPCTKWTRRVPHPVLIGHAASPSHTPLARMFFVWRERGGGGGGWAFVDSSSLEIENVHAQEVWGGV